MRPNGWSKICCAIDFSDGARAALDQAIALARHNDAELVLLHIFQPPVTTLMAEPMFSSPNVMVELERDLAAELERWRTRAQDAGVARASSEVVIAGSIHHGITDFASQHGCDAIVIGTHGRGGLSRLLLGSVAEHVVRHAGVPVVVVRPQAAAAAAASPQGT